jgi:hypothetical protein
MRMAVPLLRGTAPKEEKVPAAAAVAGSHGGSDGRVHDDQACAAAEADKHLTPQAAPWSARDHARASMREQVPLMNRHRRS